MFVLESMVFALSLSMDAFAVALCMGACVTGATNGTAFRMGMVCGVFQFLMPLAGWFLGVYCVDYIASVDHWVAFGLLGFVGGNMILNSFAPAEACDTKDPTLGSALFYLAFATSIDALAVGASFAVVYKPVLWLAVSSGVITAILCFGGVHFGRSVGCRLGKGVEFLGGILLCALGLNILRIHLGA